MSKARKPKQPTRAEYEKLLTYYKSELTDVRLKLSLVRNELYAVHLKREEAVEKFESLVKIGVRIPHGGFGDTIMCSMQISKKQLGKAIDSSKLIEFVAEQLTIKLLRLK